MDMGLVAAISAMMQAGVQSNVQLAVFKENMDTSQGNALKLLQTMPSVDVNPSVGRNLNLVA
ncbi:MAG: YjfB family protein [Mariprofundaceae bacterium]